MIEHCRGRWSAGQAPIAGVCYLAVIAGGGFVALFVREPLLTAGDAEPRAA